MKGRSSSSSRPSKVLKSNESDMSDTISDLPEPILHYILSFLDMKQVVHTSLLSRRWRYLWMSLPYLNFDRLFWLNFNQNKPSKDRFIDFVDNVMFLREKCNIHKFSLSCGSYYNSGRLEKWILAAVRQGLQEFHLEIRDGQLLKLPDCLFSSAISVFKLRSNRTSTTPVQPPNSMCSASHLKTLQLVSVKLPAGDLNGELLFNCPLLENLIMRDCHISHLKVVNISSAFQLTKLVLQTYKWGHASFSCKIRICTPNLTSLECDGYMRNDCSLENLSSLVSANISSRSYGYQIVNAQKLIDILKGLYNAKSLILSGWQHETSSGSPYMLERLPKPFNNLRYLKLTKWHNSSSISAIAKLLESSPYIETLVLEIESTFNSGNNGEDWGAQLSFDCFFYNLKYVEIKNLEGYKNELKFLEFLLKNAVVLENISITTNKARFMGREKELDEFSETVEMLPRASTSVTVQFF